MSHPASARLLLDEMVSPAIAAALRDLGQDLIAVAERGELRAMSNGDVFAWAISQRRWLLTENVKDFRPILLRALQADTATTGSSTPAAALIRLLLRHTRVKSRASQTLAGARAWNQ